MKRILFSWLAVQNDFINGEINETGPTVNMHAYHWRYSRHFLLHTPDTRGMAFQMKKYLNRYFQTHPVQLVSLDVKRVHVDLQVIVSKIETLLLQYADYPMDLLLSTGSGLMKIAWFLAHSKLHLDTQLVQILAPWDSRDSLEPDLHIINIEQSQTPVSAIIREQNIKKTKDINPIITPSLANIYNKAFKIAQADNVSVLILGNTGTGKEVLAKYIHSQSARKHKPFIAINCSAFSDQLLESRLFGHAKGSFTGADKEHKGIFEQANGGIVFLDEIGDISPYMQQTLLRFLQFKEIQPIGGRTKKVDVRIIAATNRNVKELLTGKNFRNDLFHRLGIVLELPNFKDLKIKEKKIWIDHFLKLKQAEYGRKKPLELEKNLLDFLLTYDFPGNIRELQNFIDNLYVFATEKAGLSDLPYYLKNITEKNSLKLADIERIHILKVLDMFEGNKTKTAKALGIALNTLKAKLKSYDNDVLM